MRVLDRVEGGGGEGEDVVGRVGDEDREEESDDGEAEAKRGEGATLRRKRAGGRESRHRTGRDGLMVVQRQVESARARTMLVGGAE